MVELLVRERQLLGLAAHQRHPFGQPSVRIQPCLRAGQHLRALVEANHLTAVASNQLLGHESCARGHVEHALAVPALARPSTIARRQRGSWPKLRTAATRS